jgi:hypothetical protein
MRDLGGRTCASTLRDVLRLLGRFSVIIIAPVFHVHIRRPSTLHCLDANSLAQQATRRTITFINTENGRPWAAMTYSATE